MIMRLISHLNKIIELSNYVISHNLNYVNNLAMMNFSMVYIYLYICHIFVLCLY